MPELKKKSEMCKNCDISLKNKKIRTRNKIA